MVEQPIQGHGIRRRIDRLQREPEDRKSTRLNSSHSQISYAVFCLKKKTRDIQLLLSRNRYCTYLDTRSMFHQIKKGACAKQIYYEDDATLPRDGDCLLHS